MVGILLYFFGAIITIATSGITNLTAGFGPLSYAPALNKLCTPKPGGLVESISLLN